eukprot:scaffold72683_cov69-Phaeocystis_antarctica.AAC.2
MSCRNTEKVGARPALDRGGFTKRQAAAWRQRQDRAAPQHSTRPRSTRRRCSRARRGGQPQPLRRPASAAVRAPRRRGGAQARSRHAPRRARRAPQSRRGRDCQASRRCVAAARSPVAEAGSRRDPRTVDLIGRPCARPQAGTAHQRCGAAVKSARTGGDPKPTAQTAASRCRPARKLRAGGVRGLRTPGRPSTLHRAALRHGPLPGARSPPFFSTLPHR